MWTNGEGNEIKCDGCGKPFDGNIPATCHGGKAHGFTLRPTEVTTFAPSMDPIDAIRADRDALRALLREARGAVLRDYVNDDLLSRIDAALGGQS